MIIIIKQVVKIGGSLFPKYAIDLADRLENTGSLIILGGGEFANLIRKYNDEMDFSEETNHWTAIDCMDIIAKLVNDKVESARLAYTIDEAKEISDDGFTPIFVVSEFLRAEDPFECSWDVTSDSIAAYIAHLINDCGIHCTPHKCKAFNSNKCKWYIYPRTKGAWFNIHR